MSCGKYSPAKKFLFGIIFKLPVKRNTCQEKHTEKFSDGSLMFVYIGLNSFKINFNPTRRCSFAPLTWKGLCPLSWQEYWGRFHDFSATKPSCFLLCTWGSSRPPLTTLPEWPFRDCVLNYAIQLLSEAQKGLGFPVLISAQFKLTMQFWALYDFNFLICKMDIAIIALSTVWSGFMKWNYVCENAYDVVKKCQLVFRLCTISFRTWHLTNGEAG